MSAGATTRNSSTADLDPGVVLANLGQFITYIERIYALIDFYTANGVEV